MSKLKGCSMRCGRTVISCRSCRRLRSFDLDLEDQKIAAFGSSYRGMAFDLKWGAVSRAVRASDTRTCRGPAAESAASAHRERSCAAPR
ncbi:hypothetical protein E3W21_19550 [Pseudomonas sp. F01002]|nr:hypothetical protein E3W21_19550 [Pseudomonas sp. F01002]